MHVDKSGVGVPHARMTVAALHNRPSYYQVLPCVRFCEKRIHVAQGEETAESCAAVSLQMAYKWPYQIKTCDDTAKAVLTDFVFLHGVHVAVDCTVSEDDVHVPVDDVRGVPHNSDRQVVGISGMNDRFVREMSEEWFG